MRPGEEIGPVPLVSRDHAPGNAIVAAGDFAVYAPEIPLVTAARHLVGLTVALEIDEVFVLQAESRHRSGLSLCSGRRPAGENEEQK